MNFVIYLVVGSIAGWLASLLMRRNSSMGILANIVVGILFLAQGDSMCQTSRLMCLTS